VLLVETVSLLLLFDEVEGSVEDLELLVELVEEEEEEEDEPQPLLLLLEVEEEEEEDEPQPLLLLLEVEDDDEGLLLLLLLVEAGGEELLLLFDPFVATALAIKPIKRKLRNFIFAQGCELVQCN